MKLYSILRRLFGDKRGSADLNTYLLLTAAGCTLVGVTAPHLYKSSKTASSTFDEQVKILERANSSSGGSSSGGSSGGGSWDLGNTGGLGQLAGVMPGGGGQLASPGGQLASPGGQLDNPGSQLASPGGRVDTPGTQLANPGGQLASGGGAPVVTGSSGNGAAKNNDPKNTPNAAK